MFFLVGQTTSIIRANLTIENNKNTSSRRHFTHDELEHWCPEMSFLPFIE